MILRKFQLRQANWFFFLSVGPQFAANMKLKFIVYIRQISEKHTRSWNGRGFGSLSGHEKILPFSCDLRRDRSLAYAVLLSAQNFHCFIINTEPGNQDRLEGLHVVAEEVTILIQCLFFISSCSSITNVSIENECMYSVTHNKFFNLLSIL
jgi:hypothetical protein